MSLARSLINKRKREIIKQRTQRQRIKITGRLPSPQPGKQTEFLKSDADIVLYGGSAGSGKSVGLLLDFARNDLISNPCYGGVIFRRTHAQVRNEGGLWDASLRLYPAISAVANKTITSWTFPSGASIRFAHLQHEKNIYDWQGTEIARLGFDEITLFTKKQFIYLISRARSTIGITPKVRMTCNPDAESWVAEMVAWYIDDSGLPITERSGVVRHFIVYEDKFVWADTKEELQHNYPHSIPKSFTFISALITDNPLLLKKDPGYLANLHMQHSIDRARLLDGNWRVKPQSGKVFNKTWFRFRDFKLNYEALVRFWDMASTAKGINADAYYTASVLLGLKEDGTIDVIEALADQLSPSDGDNLIINTAASDGKEVFVAWEEEGGASGKRVSQYLSDRLQGYDTHPIRPMGDKLTRAKPVATEAERGNIYLIPENWNENFLDAIHLFDGTPRPLTNDYVDALSGAYAFLSDSEQLRKRQYKRFLEGGL